MSVTSFEVVLEFVNDKLTINSKRTSTAEGEATFVVGSDKSLAVV